MQHDHHDTHEHQQTSLATYFAVFAGLMALLGATIWVVFMHLGPMAFPVAMLIAITKASLVLYFFMHLNHAGKIVWWYIIFGFAGLVILIIFFLVDYLSRDWPQLM